MLHILPLSTTFIPMKSTLIFLCLMLVCSYSLRASNTFIDYQNYNHGYCPECNCYPCRCDGTCPPTEDNPNPCPSCPSGKCSAGELPPPPVGDGEKKECNVCKQPNPCDPAPVCGTNCGISLCWVGLAIAGVAAAAAIIVTSNNGSTPSHGSP